MNLPRFNQSGTPEGLRQWTTKTDKHGTHHTFRHNHHKYRITEQGAPIDEVEFAAWFNDYASKIPAAAFVAKCHFLASQPRLTYGPTVASIEDMLMTVLAHTQEDMPTSLEWTGLFFPTHTVRA